MKRKYIIGIDEVGRGCLAGPITVGAIFKKGRVNLRGIKDSKQLSAKQREEWQQKIQNPKSKFQIATALVGAQIIDKIGISSAARLAVGRCLRKLSARGGSAFGGQILLDGSLYAPRTYQNQTTIIKGDEKISLIAAASIIAKVYRDKKMVRLAKLFPKYGLDIHKGYGTALHRRAIKKHGLSAIHRKTFCTKLS